MAIGYYDARMRVLAKYLNLRLGISYEKFEEIEDIIVKNFTDYCHEPTEYAPVLTLSTLMLSCFQIFKLLCCDWFARRRYIA